MRKVGGEEGAEGDRRQVQHRLQRKDQHQRKLNSSFKENLKRNFSVQLQLQGKISTST